MATPTWADYAPPWWLRGAHRQTMIGRVLRRRPKLDTRIERWPMPDGDHLTIEIADPPVPPKGTVVVLHGLEGSSSRSYVQLTLEHLVRLGVRGVAMNFRSCGGEVNRRPRFYHAGETGDLGVVVDRIRREDPDQPLGAIGFSLGGNVLLKHLGETGSDAEICGAVAVSVPFDLAAGARLIGRGWAGKVYTHYFLRSLKAKLEAKVAEGYPEAQLDPDMVRRGLQARTLLAYDDAVTAPLHGFADAAAYYAASSSARWLPQIRVPSLLLHAEDDPFLPKAYLPMGVFEANPAVSLRLTQRGGHLGFLHPGPHGGAATARPTDARLGLGCWAERTAAEAVSHFLTGSSDPVSASPDES